MLSVGQFLVTVIEFLGVWALFERFGQIGGWTPRRGRRCSTALVNVTFAIADAVTRGFDVFGIDVRAHRRLRPPAAAPAQPPPCSCSATSCG